MNVNCQSLVSKVGAMRNLITSHQPDIIVATETWLTKDIYSAELELDEYTIYRRDRSNKIGGGVMVANSQLHQLNLDKN